MKSIICILLVLFLVAGCSSNNYPIKTIESKPINSTEPTGNPTPTQVERIPTSRPSPSPSNWKAINSNAKIIFEGWKNSGDSNSSDHLSRGIFILDLSGNQLKQIFTGQIIGESEPGVVFVGAIATMSQEPLRLAGSLAAMTVHFPSRNQGRVKCL